MSIFFGFRATVDNRLGHVIRTPEIEKKKLKKFSVQKNFFKNRLNNALTLNLIR